MYVARGIPPWGGPTLTLIGATHYRLCFLAESVPIGPRASKIVVLPIENATECHGARMLHLGRGLPISGGSALG